MTILKGVLAAAVTPLQSDFSPAPDFLIRYLSFLEDRGCHGALLLGTTGEGPSLSPNQRQTILQRAIDIRNVHPDFVLLAGTGTPSLDETIELTRLAFDLEYDGVVVLPPYYFRNASDDGMFRWFSEVIRRGVPRDGALLGYHIPPVSGVKLSLELLVRLKETFPDRFVGLKDSSGDLEFANKLGQRFGGDLKVFNGNDRLFTTALQSRAAGCITAAANLISPNLRIIWDTFQSGILDNENQKYVDRIREILDRYSPIPPLIKALLASNHGFPRWAVSPPLNEFPHELEDEVTSLLNLA
jgi:4-hydroxy-tetrahydrodipicolinate synthase